MDKSNISKQAENYAEVIVNQIAGNFTALQEALKECPALVQAQKNYDKLSPKDAPLKDIEAAKTRVKIIEDNIGDLICDEYNTVEPLAVGLFGEWGSGKTHQLKLIKKRILDNPDIFPETTIPIFFNAWRFEKEEHIILPLFETLLNTLEKYEHSPIDKAKKISKSTIHHVKNIVTSLPYGLNISSAAKTIKGIATGDVEDLAEAGKVIDGDAVKRRLKKKQMMNK